VKNPFQPLPRVLASATDSELARQVEFLKTENQILRAKLPKRITVTPTERERLVKLGKQLGDAVKELLSIVSPRTFARWINGETPTKVSRKPTAMGRPRTAKETRELILRLARENAWGYTRILGELKKLGVKASRSTIVNVLKENGIDPGAKRGVGTWHEFLTRHAATLWATDFFSKKVCMPWGLTEFFLLFVIHYGSRRVHVVGMTAHPDHAWMKQQARNLSMFFAEQTEKPRYLIRDLDGKFVSEFDAILESDGMKIVPVGPRSPNLNSLAERWILSAKSECLDHFLVFGEEHLRYIIKSYEVWYNEKRPHQGVGNVPLTASAADTGPGEVVCDERLGGLLRHYQRMAA
jgi:putative transposase